MIASAKERAAIEHRKQAVLNRKKGLAPLITGMIVGMLVGIPLSASITRAMGYGRMLGGFIGLVLFGIFGAIIGNFLEDISEIFIGWRTFSARGRVLAALGLIIAALLLVITYSFSIIGP